RELGSCRECLTRCSLFWSCGSRSCPAEHSGEAHECGIECILSGGLGDGPSALFVRDRADPVAERTENLIRQIGGCLDIHLRHGVRGRIDPFSAALVVVLWPGLAADNVFDRCGRRRERLSPERCCRLKRGDELLSERGRRGGSWGICSLRLWRCRERGGQQIAERVGLCWRGALFYWRWSALLSAEGRAQKRVEGVRGRH